jgi:hypothetical protein
MPSEFFRGFVFALAVSTVLWTAIIVVIWIAISGFTAS